jgi:hypothetical protein
MVDLSLNELSIFLEGISCLFKLSLQLDMSKLLGTQHTGDDFVVHSAEINDCNFVCSLIVLQEIFIVPLDPSTDFLQCITKRNAQIFD